ncbi:hypothetical protein AB2L27_05230 [Kineococcus sp. LSe6-4]|uniref:Septum formation-related domain-containing protein n=1 Tax=Kineococcus halophytocola TaxID=3234027 RepID=A0ABV4GYM9_9ACTN
MTRRLPWVALGAGGALAVQVAAGLGVAAYAVATDRGDSETIMNPPVARELDSPPPWPVGTCLREQRPAPCTEGHDAEVVAITDPGGVPTDDVRRWTADAVCARTVTTLAAGLRPALFTYASLYPSPEVSRRDARVTCLLVAPRRTPLVGSLTAGDLRPPQPPLPFE